MTPNIIVIPGRFFSMKLVATGGGISSLAAMPPVKPDVNRNQREERVGGSSGTSTYLESCVGGKHGYRAQTHTHVRATCK